MRELRREMRTVGPLDVEVLRGGQGPATLVLHGFHNFAPDAPLLTALCARTEVIAPSFPGFGQSARPDAFDSIYDLVRLSLELIDELHVTNLVGLSFGGWVALEVATIASSLSRLALIDSLGVKLSDRETPDIADIFNLHPDDVRERSWNDPSLGVVDFDQLSDDDIVVYARNREALCLYGWEPYMRSPELPRWLRRIRMPTLLLWGASDRIVTVDYGRALARQLPNARFEVIAGAGHHPEVEQFDRVAEHLLPFLDDGD